LLLSNSNPVYSSLRPGNSIRVWKRFLSPSSFSHSLDETSRMAHLLLPAIHPWILGGLSAPKTVRGLMQPSWALFSTPGISAISSSIRGKNFTERRDSPGRISINFSRRLKSAPWIESLKRGGSWKRKEFRPPRYLYGSKTFLSPLLRRGAATEKEIVFHFISPRAIFRRTRVQSPWLQELPTPVIQTTWGSWVESTRIRPQEFGLQKGDLVRSNRLRDLLKPLFALSWDSPRNPCRPYGKGHGSSDALPPAGE